MPFVPAHDPDQRELFPPPPERPWTPRIFDGDEEDKISRGDAETRSEGAGLTARMTLGEFYRAYVRPICLIAGGASPRSIDQYDQTIALWQRFTLDPPLDQIDEFCAAKFLAGLRALPARLKGSTVQASTVRKHCVHAQCVLDRAGPRGRAKGGPRSRRGAGLLEEPPLIEKPAQKRPRTKNVWTLEEIGLALEACHAAQIPSTPAVPAAAFWQSLLLVLYNGGLRIGAAMSLRWDWLETDQEQRLWLNIPARVPPPWTNKSRQDLRVFCNAFAAAAIERMRGASGELVFPWPFGESYLHQFRQRLWERSKLPAPRRFGFHAIRKRANTEIEKINAVAAKMFLGHACDLDVNVGHYSAQEILVEAVQKLPQPIFTPAAGSRQLELF